MLGARVIWKPHIRVHVGFGAVNVRDVKGTIWQLDAGNVVQKRADGVTIVYEMGEI